MGKLTTHVLDTSKGVPASNMTIKLYYLDEGKKELIGSFITNKDGRVDHPLLEGTNFRQGTYEIVFHAGAYQKNIDKTGDVTQKISIDWTLPRRVYDFMLLTENLDEETINNALSLTGVTHLKNKNLGDLSGGEFQRVLLARAISKKPELLVLDEPVQGVDFTGEIALYELIKKISDELNCGILLISHDLHTVMSATDHVVCLNGHVCCSGSPMDVAKNNEYKALFGEQASQILSRYEHRHDHVHTSEGEIKKN